MARKKSAYQQRYAHMRKLGYDPARARRGAKSGCYIATAVYGSYDCSEVWTLRRFRDFVLSQNWYGRVFISVYYLISPTLVKCFGKSKWFTKAWKGTLDRIVAKLQSVGIESTPYEDKMY